MGRIIGDRIGSRFGLRGFAVILYSSPLITVFKDGAAYTEVALPITIKDITPIAIERFSISKPSYLPSSLGIDFSTPNVSENTDTKLAHLPINEETLPESTIPQ